MGQCVSNQEETQRTSHGSRGRMGRDTSEETRSLMRHEGGYDDGDNGIGGGGGDPRYVPLNNGHHTRSTSENGYPESSETETDYFLQPRSMERRPMQQELVDVAGVMTSCSEEEEGTRVQHQAVRISLPVQTEKGAELMKQLSKAYRWREQFSEPTSEFLALMDRLYMECQLHLTDLSSRGDQESRREADTIVSEMVTLRNYWGPRLLPSSTCNAFVRERIPLTLGVDQRQFRVDCAQFFEPVPFYGNHQSSCPGELMKLYRFSVYNVTTNEVVLRYYLETSNITQVYHVLCFLDEKRHGQVKPYGEESPSYWNIRSNMLEDASLRLLNAITPGAPPAPKPLAVTVFPSSSSSSSSSPSKKSASD